jgi:hypothetical protein
VQVHAPVHRDLLFKARAASLRNSSLEEIESWFDSDRR